MSAVNTPISATDYNVIQTSIQEVMGTGATNYGYGQVVNSSPVSISNRVTINEWGLLRYDLINAYVHLFNTTPTGVDALVEGETVRYNISNAPVEYWLSVANTISSNRLNLAVAGQRLTVNHGTKDITTTWGSTNNLRAYTTVTFSSSEDARFFFNSGGSVQFTASRSGGSGTTQNASWTSLLSTAGTRIFGGNTPGTGTEPNDGTNWFRLSASLQNWSTVTASSPYSLNSWQIKARATDVTDNSNGTSREIEFELNWIDDHFPLGGSPTDFVDGTLSYTVQTVQATGTLQPVSAGTFNIQTPIVSVGTPFTV